MGVGLNAGDELVDIVDEFDHVVDFWFDVVC
jgi:hypothetical protein